MWNNEWFEDQVQRVRDTPWDISIIETEPVVARVQNEDLEREDDVTPESIHCSCTAHGGETPFCDHIIALLDADCYAGSLMREYLKERKNELESQQSRSQASAPTIQEEIDDIMSLLVAIDIDDFSLARTNAELIQLFGEGADEEEANHIQNAPKPDEDRDAFEEMVRKVRIGPKQESNLPSDN
jgi:hypothetical protein